tara:strand:+ start:5495 stop:5902 length:408 start_codon:yes stop_codon:yes gene_type:complete
VETGTEFPQEFLGVWERDVNQEPDGEGSFIYFESDTVTYFGRVGDIDDPTCYVISPLYEIIKYEGNVYTLNVLALDEKTLGELTIEVDGNVMKWIISKNDIDRWIKSNEDVSTFTPDCGIEFKSKSMFKFQNLRK